jgi:hypothetical protein
VQIQPDTGNACSIVATLSMPGTYTLTLVNSDGSQSLPFAFTVVSGIAPVVTAVNPASPLVSTSLVPFAVIGSGFSTTVNVDGFTVTGSGATPGKTVTMTRMRIEGGAAVTATITADSQGGFVSGPTVETLAGTYTELWVDATTHASTNVA